jgi:N-acetylmuramoyl-L-alanine amidase
MATGKSILTLGRKHVGEKYVLGTMVPKNNSAWSGPWDCAEFTSWLVFQVAGVLYGCDNDHGNPATADAYTGYWARDSKALGIEIAVEDAAATPGAMILRTPAAGAMGHIVVSDGTGGTVEAHSTKRGVIASTLDGRRWDTGILITGVDYTQGASAEVAPPKTLIVRLTEPDHMTGSVVKEIQRALKAAGFSPGPIDGDFGSNTHTAVMAFQASRGLVADGEVGPQTAKRLDVTLPPA